MNGVNTEKLISANAAMAMPNIMLTNTLSFNKSKSNRATSQDRCSLLAESDLLNGKINIKVNLLFKKRYTFSDESQRHS